ncbi:toxin VasX [Actinobacillus vicugnae]|uniref:toxin VasX n=1 Tax=Actinobacillus vicugnae TaxID=2573093 RepID=UPI001242A847|nr:toxin VasX [Actinobacillus vicugnae]
MTTNLPFEPKAQPIDSICKECQEFYYLYPVRLALTEQAFKNIETAGTVPTLPSDGRANADYDLRRLRDGYIYILATDISSPQDLSAISAKADSPKAWYIYRYRSPELESISANSTALPAPYHFRQYHCENGDLSQNWTANVLSTPCIMLNKAIQEIDILYSDFALPIALLNKLSADSNARKDWMKKVTLRSGHAVDILTLKESVKDFAPDTKLVIEEPSNQYRFGAVGRIPTGFVPTITPRGNEKGEIIALEDMVGTTRDLAHFHVYLDNKRKAVLKQYEYAITTAQVIDAHMQKMLVVQNEAINNKNKLAASKAHQLYTENQISTFTGMTPQEFTEKIHQKPLTLSEFYQYKKAFLNEQHLSQNSHQDIFAKLKSDLLLDNDIPGVNAINKMANVTHCYGKPFKNVVSVHTQLIASNNTNLKIRGLLSLLEQKKDKFTAEAWCLLMHGLFFGLDYSTIGQNAIIAALSGGVSALPQDTAVPEESVINILQKGLSYFEAGFSSIEKAKVAAQMDMVKFDLVVNIVIDKYYAQQFSKHNRGKPIQVRQTIEDIYAIHPKTSETISHLRQKTDNGKNLPKNAKKLSERYRVSITVPVLDNDNYQVFQTSQKPLGLTKLVGYQPIVDFFLNGGKSSTAATAGGQIAENPITGVLVMFAQEFAPESGLKHNITEALSNLNANAHKAVSGKGVLDLGKMQKASTISQHLTLIKNGILNANTVFAGIGALIELGSWYEAQYQGDRISMRASGMKIAGGLAVEAGIGGLGILYGAKAGIINTALTGVAYLVLGIGVVLVIGGIIYGLSAPKSIETWMKNGFWGNSENYWGNAEKAYGWTEQRLKSFLKQFDDSLLDYKSGSLSQKDTYNFYQIEMQRYFKSSHKVQVSAIDKHTFRVQHPSLTTEQIANEIRVEEIIFNGIILGKPILSEKVELEAEGSVILYFPQTEWESISPYQNLEGKYTYKRKDEELRMIGLKLFIPEYQGSNKPIEREWKEIPF